MIAIAISLLWFLIGALVLALVIYLVLKGIKIFIPIDGRIEQVIWLIFGILCLIYILMALTGGGVSVPFRFH